MQRLFRHAIPLATLLMLTLVAGAQPPAPSKPDAFSFAVFGDNRPNAAGRPQPESFRRILGKLAELKPAFAVNTGDSIYGAWSLPQMQRQYKEYTDTIAGITDTKVYLALGNHEVHGSKDFEAFFKKELGGLYYSFDYGSAHFIVLDSELVGQQGRIAEDQLEWLKQDLYDARAARHKFVFMHRPMYPVDGHAGKCLDQYPKDRDALHALFVRNRVIAVFAGHEHLFDEQVKNSVRYIITGGGGAFLNPSYLGTGDFHHYIVVSVDGNKVETRVEKLAENGAPAETIRIGNKR